MATNRKRLLGLSMVGLVFVLTGGTWLVVGRPAVAAGMFTLGLALVAAGLAAARKAGSISDNAETPPPADGGSDHADPGAAPDRGRM